MEFSFSSFFEHLLPSSWFESLSHSQGFDMTHDEVTQSVHDASDFFHIDDPMVVKEGWTTGVYPNMTLTEMDDVLIYNREQMTDMGITEKYAFDLIMTHEGTHRMLQGMNTGFSPHQEELCCDYMAGVRAGLNGLDVSQMEDSLVNSHASASHPDGHSRVESIEKGVEFAEHYMKEHGVPPTFTECIEYFSENVLDDHVLAWVTLREEGTPVIPRDFQFQGFADSGTEASAMPNQKVHEFHHGGRCGNATGDYIDDSHPLNDEHGDLKGFVDNRAARLRWAQEAKENAEWHEKRSKDAIARGDLSAARSHAESAAMYRRQERDEIAASKKCTK